MKVFELMRQLVALDGSLELLADAIGSSESGTMKVILFAEGRRLDPLLQIPMTLEKETATT
jgi:hypothetical protein